MPHQRSSRLPHTGIGAPVRIYIPVLACSYPTPAGITVNIDWSERKHRSREARYIRRVTFRQRVSTGRYRLRRLSFEFPGFIKEAKNTVRRSSLSEEDLPLGKVREIHCGSSGQVADAKRRGSHRPKARQMLIGPSGATIANIFVLQSMAAGNSVGIYPAGRSAWTRLSSMRAEKSSP